MRRVPGEGFFSADNFSHIAELTVITAFDFWHGYFVSASFETAPIFCEGEGDLGWLKRLDGDGAFSPDDGELSSRPSKRIVVVAADGGQGAVVAKGGDLVV